MSDQAYAALALAGEIEALTSPIAPSENDDGDGDGDAQLYKWLEVASLLAPTEAEPADDGDDD